MVGKDDGRPWAGFLLIDEAQAQRFANSYFNGLDVQSLRIAGKLSPKMLLVAPAMRLSRQYHHRRAEIWQVVQGTVGIITSEDDTEGELRTFGSGTQIHLQQGERHRLVGR